MFTGHHPCIKGVVILIDIHAMHASHYLRGDLPAPDIKPAVCFKSQLHPSFLPYPRTHIRLTGWQGQISRSVFRHFGLSPDQVDVFGDIGIPRVVFIQCFRIIAVYFPKPEKA